MCITTRKQIINLQANKTFAGRTENGKVGCKFCKSHNIVKNGKKDGKQLYRCNECGKQFVDNGNFPRARINARAVSLALESYFNGLSLSKIVFLLKRAYGIKIDRSTVWRWIQKYVPMVKDKVTSKLKINAAQSWHVDETAIKVKGELNWFWDGIDYNSRFLVNGLVSKTRTMGSCKKFFKGAQKQVNGESPDYIFTDGCGVYERGPRKVFWPKIVKGNTKVVMNVGIYAKTGKASNNIIERWHNTLKERYKATRGFGSRKGAENWLDGFVIQYNYIREHMSLKGKTPAQATGLDLPIENGWGDLIQWSIL
jgi:transposase-like protein